MPAKAKQELALFTAKIAGVGALSTALSCWLYESRRLRFLPLWGWKQFYSGGDGGEVVPCTRGWFHGIMAVAHAARAASIRSYLWPRATRYLINWLPHEDWNMSDMCCTYAELEPEELMHPDTS